MTFRGENISHGFHRLSGERLLGTQHFIWVVAIHDWLPSARLCRGSCNPAWQGERLSCVGARNEEEVSPIGSARANCWDIEDAPRPSDPIG